MSFPIDSTRGPSAVRRTRKTAKRSPSAEAADAANLPVPVEAPKPLSGGSARPGGDAAIHAQVIGERRGLRAGPTIHDEARASYTRTAWSGASDRRRPKGGTTKTEV